MGAETPLKLNIGCGREAEAGWLNLDLTTPEAELRASTMQLPFRDGTFVRTNMAHVLEHVAEPEGALAEACRVTWGPVLVTVPDILGSLETWCLTREGFANPEDGGLVEDELLYRMARGGGEWLGDVHRWFPTWRHVEELIRAVGRFPRAMSPHAAFLDGWPMKDVTQWSQITYLAEEAL